MSNSLHWSEISSSKCWPNKVNCILCLPLPVCVRCFFLSRHKSLVIFFLGLNVPSIRESDRLSANWKTFLTKTVAFTLVSLSNSVSSNTEHLPLKVTRSQPAFTVIYTCTHSEGGRQRKSFEILKHEQNPNRVPNQSCRDFIFQNQATPNQTIVCRLTNPFCSTSLSLPPVFYIFTNQIGFFNFSTFEHFNLRTF